MSYALAGLMGGIGGAGIKGLEWQREDRRQQAKWNREAAIRKADQQFRQRLEQTRMENNRELQRQRDAAADARLGRSNELALGRLEQQNLNAQELARIKNEMALGQMRQTDVSGKVYDAQGDPVMIRDVPSEAQFDEAGGIMPAQERQLRQATTAAKPHTIRSEIPLYDASGRVVMDENDQPIMRDVELVRDAEGNYQDVTPAAPPRTPADYEEAFSELRAANDQTVSDEEIRAFIRREWPQLTPPSK